MSGTTFMRMHGIVIGGGGEPAVARWADAEGEAPGVAEIAGMHGAFSFPERLLQQIWLRG